MSCIAQSFKTADDKPLTIKKAKANIFDDLQKLDDEELARDLVAIKRKKMNESEGRKKTRVMSPVKKASTSLYSPGTSNTTNDGYNDDWSDCDENELSKSINIFNQSIATDVSNTKDGHENNSDLAYNNKDGETDWSDDDEELLQSVSLLQQETSFSSAMLDRSVLHEISNLSWTDQSESNSHNL